MYIAISKKTTLSLWSLPLMSRNVRNNENDEFSENSPKMARFCHFRHLNISQTHGNFFQLFNFHHF